MTLAHLLVGFACLIASSGCGVQTEFTADRRGAAIKHSGNCSLAKRMEPSKLDRNAFFDAEFLIRHGHTVSDWSGVVPSLCRRHGINIDASTGADVAECSAGV